MEKIFYLTLIFILFLNFVSSSIPLISLNEDLSAGETYVGYFDARLKNSLTKEDLKIYEERREVYFEKDIFTYKNRTFVFVIFPKKGNFTMVIKSFLYYDNETLKEGGVTKTFFVKDNATKILQISPGIIVGKELNFSISNKGKENILVAFQNYSYSLKENESKRVFANPEKDFFYLEVKSYKTFRIPVIFISFQNETFNQTLNTTINKTENSSLNETKQNNAIKKIEINETKIERYFEVNKTEIISFLIKNLLRDEMNMTFKTEMKNLNFSESIFLSPLEERPVFLEYSPNETGNFEGNFTLSYENESINISLKFYVVTSESLEIIEKIKSEKGDKISSCEEINGTLCTMTGYTCKNGNNVPLIGVGFCCVGGECIKIEEDKPRKSFSNYIIGIIFLILAGIIGYFTYKKYSNVKPEGLKFNK